MGPYGRWYGDLPDQRDAAGALQLPLPLLSAHRRWAAAALLQAPDPLPRLEGGLGTQRAARADRLGVPRLRRVHRLLRLDDRLRDDLRPDLLLVRKACHARGERTARVRRHRRWRRRGP